MTDLLYISWDVNPNLYDGFITLRYYSLLFAISFFLGYYLMKRMMEKENCPEQWLDKILIYTVVATVIGARLGHVLFYDPGYYFRNPIDILKIWEGGLASHGAAIAIIIALWWFSRKISKKSILWALDKVVVTIAIAACFIRIGNLMNSEIIGTQSNSNLAFFFEYEAKRTLSSFFNVSSDEIEINSTNSIKQIDAFNYPIAHVEIMLPYQIDSKRIDSIFYVHYGSNYLNSEQHFFSLDPKEYKSNFKNKILTTTIGVIPRIPTQLIEAGCYLILFLFLFWGYWRRNWYERQGLLFGLFLTFLFGARFVIEFFKEHQTLQDESLLNMGQWLSIPAVIIGLIFVILAIYKPKKEFNEE